jgi:hypothetical protein
MDVTTTKAAAAKGFFAALTMVLLAGCESVECDRYRGLVEDNDKYSEAIAWADASIFSLNPAARDPGVGVGGTRAEEVGESGGHKQPASVVAGR